MKRSAGYSLVEVLVVIALIGIVTVAGVPAFLQYTRANAIRSAARQVIGDIRAVRQKAVTEMGRGRLEFSVGASTYQGYVSRDGGTTWSPVWPTPRQMDKGTYFQNTTFVDEGGTTAPDVAFLQSGMASRAGTLELHIGYKDVPLNHYAISLTVAGQLTTASSHVDL